MTTKTIDVIDLRKAASSLTYIGADTENRFAVAITPLTNESPVVAVMISERVLKEMLAGIRKKKK